MTDERFIPEDAYVLVSQGFVIDWVLSKETALREAAKLNHNWLEYKQRCLDNHEPYADNAVYVYYRGEMIANPWGEVKSDV